MENKHLADYLQEIQAAIAMEGGIPNEFLEFGAAWGETAYDLGRLCASLKELVVNGQTSMEIMLPRRIEGTPSRCPPTRNSFIQIRLDIQMFAICAPGPGASGGWLSHFVDSEAIAVILPFESWDEQTFSPNQQWHMLIERGDDG
jgi:hypothetical protein